MADSIASDLAAMSEALGARIAASLGQRLGLPYDEAKAHYTLLLRVDAQRTLTAGAVLPEVPSPSPLYSVGGHPFCNGCDGSAVRSGPQWLHARDNTPICHEPDQPHPHPLPA